MFRLANLDGRAALEIDGRYADLATLSGDASLGDPMAAIARYEELHAFHERASAAAQPASGDQLGPCVPRPEKVFGIGLNYRSHASEAGMTAPPAPMTFTKFPSCLCGPTATVVLSGDNVDWEVELVVVIGRAGRNIARADAWSHVAGLTLGQDISDRTVQFTGTPAQFCLGKSFDSYGPIGPVVV